MAIVNFCIALIACLMFAADGRSAVGATTKCFANCQVKAQSHFDGLVESGSLNSTRGGWQLVRIRNPRGGPDTVSIMHSAEISRSDIALAGMVLRCTTAPDVDTIVVVVEPWPPGS